MALVALELARRGYAVVGVDFTEDYIARERSPAHELGLDSVAFVLADVREVDYREAFDVVLNMADGAIGYFETEEDNLRLFDVIANALKPGGKHVMGICSAAHAEKHFPRRHWEAGSRSLSLADFRWVPSTRRMVYRGHVLTYGEPLMPLSDDFPEDGMICTRLYTIEELDTILAQRGMCGSPPPTAATRHRSPRPPTT